MDLVETKHFRARWKSRVGRYDPAIRKLIYDSIDSGNTRANKARPGLLIGVRYKRKVIYVLSIPKTENLLFLITVLTNSELKKLGWKPMKLRIPDRFKRHICRVCGDPCVPMTSGEHWFNKKRGIYETVIVCETCEKKFGEWAKSMASVNSDAYYRRVIGWESSGTTKKSAGPSN